MNNSRATFPFTLKPLMMISLAACATPSQGAGFALIEQSVSGLGNAYAGAAASAEDASTNFFNPAGLTRLTGTQINAGAHIVAPMAKFRDSGSVSSLPGSPALFGTDGSDGGKVGAAPNLYYATELSDDLRFGLGINAPFGLSTDYSDQWRGRYHALKSELITVNINPNLAYKAGDRLSLGFGVNFQYIKAELSNAIDVGTICAAVAGAGACAGQNLLPLQTDGKQELEGDDWSYGFNLGLLYEFDEDSRVGFAYRSKVKQELDGDVAFTVPAGLAAFAPIAANFQNTGITADVELPETASLSLYHKTSERVAVLADVTYTKWSRFEELRVLRDNGSVLTAQPEQWDNSWRYSLGANYYIHPEWTLRTGIAYDETPIPDASLRTPRIPGNNRRWIAFGFSHHPSEHFTVDFGYAHLFVSDTPINNSEVTTGHTLIGHYEAGVDIFSVALNWDFE